MDASSSRSDHARSSGSWTMWRVVVGFLGSPQRTAVATLKTQSGRADGAGYESCIHLRPGIARCVENASHMSGPGAVMCQGPSGRALPKALLPTVLYLDTSCTPSWAQPLRHCYPRCIVSHGADGIESMNCALGGCSDGTTDSLHFIATANEPYTNSSL
jgi:hypothetical protein